MNILLDDIITDDNDWKILLVNHNLMITQVIILSVLINYLLVCICHSVVV